MMIVYASLIRIPNPAARRNAQKHTAPYFYIEVVDVSEIE